MARSFYGAMISTQSLSSLRRDERRSFVNAQDDHSQTAERDVYVVPALTFDRFTPCAERWRCHRGRLKSG